MNYPVIELNVVPRDLESLGTKEKFWFKYSPDPKADSWMFKFSKGSTGEHWSEKCASELCELLQIPHANYDLATVNGRFGVLTKNIIPPGYRMVMGNEVLHTRTADYPVPEPSHIVERVVRVREHTVSRVLGCLDMEHILPPSTDFNINHLNAGDVFCGYLMLDVLVSNQDRHHENWAIMLNNDTQECFLCPTYDHAASMGRELPEEKYAEKLTTRDENQKVSAFVRKARSELFKLKTDSKRLLTIDAFVLACEKRPRAKAHWMNKLSELKDDDIKSIFERLPINSASENAKSFACSVIIENKKRLLQHVNLQ
ncbi:hypothetical protein [Buttiauxella sp.]|uniref:hypothetical protein n=1 Tax=Buttiauxella sp. TaxID=1972222 RepID=UPI003C764551